MGYLFLLVSFVPIVFMLVMIPYVTRKTESFGVSIPEEAYQTDELKRMRKKYAWQTALLGAVVMMGWLIDSSVTSVGNPAYLVALFVFIIGSFVIYLFYHNRMKAIKAREKWHEQKREVVAVDTRFRSQKIGLSLGWFAIPLGIALATLVLTFVFYDQMPDQIPMHYDLNGHVNRWAEKSYRTVMLFPVIQLFLTALFLFVNTIIAKSKQQIDADQPEKSARQNQIFRRRWSGFTFFSGTLVVLMFSFAQLSLFIKLNPMIQMLVLIVLVGCIVMGALILSFTTGQGGSRVKTGKTKSGETINRDDDQHWKLGQFYYNPDDPAIWVEKRFGIGWTVNFAHPAGWGSLVIILLLAILLPLLIQ